MIKPDFFTEVPHFLYYTINISLSVSVVFWIFKACVHKSHQCCPNGIYSAFGRFRYIPSVLPNFATWNICKPCITQGEFFLALLIFLCTNLNWTFVSFWWSILAKQYLSLFYYLPYCNIKYIKKIKKEIYKERSKLSQLHRYMKYVLC